MYRFCYLLIVRSVSQKDYWTLLVFDSEVSQSVSGFMIPELFFLGFGLLLAIHV